MIDRPRGKVRRVWPETPKLQGMLLEVDPAVAALHQRAGQHLVFYPRPDQKLFVAIASPPGSGNRFEVLLGPSASAALSVEEGAELSFDPPAGKGFPLEESIGKDVLLFGVGSAMSPIRSAIGHIRSQRKHFGCVRVYAGAHTLEEHAYLDEAEAWEADGIEIVRSSSRPWVQEKFAADPPVLDNAVALVVGMKDMIAATKATLVAAGMSEAHIFSNF